VAANAEVLAVSARDEVALLLRPVRLPGPSGLRMGTLARATLDGGAPRELATGVVSADWLPDGELVASRVLDDGNSVLEWPVGKQAHSAGRQVMAHVRISPDAARVAFVEYKHHGYGEIVVIDRAGAPVRIPRHGDELIDGLAWNVRSGELWFAAGASGGDRCIYATTLAGERRLIQCGAGELALLDLDARGRALISATRRHTRFRIAGAPGTPEREVAWGKTDRLYDVTPDGKRLVFGAPIAGSPLFVADMPDALPVQVGTGHAHGGISPDGAWIATDRGFTPTRPGEERERDRVVDGEPIGTATGGGGWSRDGTTFYTPCASTTTKEDTCAYGLDGHGRRLYRGKRPVLARGVSPDGRSLLGIDVASGALELLATDGSQARSLPKSPALDGLGAGGTAEVVGWSADGKSVLARTDTRAPKAAITSVDLATGAATLARTLGPDDMAGDIEIPAVFATTGGYAYSYVRTVSDLYLVETP
jgi:hypothetical protein